MFAINFSYFTDSNEADGFNAEKRVKSFSAMNT